MEPNVRGENREWTRIDANWKHQFRFRRSSTRFIRVHSRSFAVNLNSYPGLHIPFTVIRVYLRRFAVSQVRGSLRAFSRTILSHSNLLRRKLRMTPTFSPVIFRSFNICPRSWFVIASMTLERRLISHKDRKERHAEENSHAPSW